MPGGVNRPSAASQPPSTSNTVPVTYAEASEFDPAVVDALIRLEQRGALAA